MRCSRSSTRAGARGSRASIWRLFGLPVEATGRFSFVVIAGLVFVVLLLGLRNASAFWLAGAVVVGYLLGAQYVLPWYVAWGLPVLALMWRSGLTALAAVQAALLELAYAADRGTAGLFHVYYAWLVPLCSLAGIVVLVSLAARTRRPGEPLPASGVGSTTPASEVPG